MACPDAQIKFQWRKKLYVQREGIEPQDEENEPPGAKGEIGFIAQEVEEVFPDLVDEDESGMKRVNYGGFTPLLLEAYKDQEARQSASEEALAALEARVGLLETTIVLQAVELQALRLQVVGGAGGQAPGPSQGEGRARPLRGARH
jgi:hypothetical protein